VRQPADPRQFLIDFLPAERRVLQRDGLHLFHIRYWSDELRRLMGRSADKVTVKYDPRDLSRVFVKLAEGYVEARPADLTRPAIALWEHHAALAALREAGRRAVDEDLIFSTILAQRALVEEAGRATKAARRQLTRRAHLAQQPLIDVTPQPQETHPDPPSALPYFEVEEWDER
jgi:putative transposase